VTFDSPLGPQPCKPMPWLQTKNRVAIICVVGHAFWIEKCPIYVLMGIELDFPRKSWHVQEVNL